MVKSPTPHPRLWNGTDSPTVSPFSSPTPPPTCRAEFSGRQVAPEGVPASLHQRPMWLQLETCKPELRPHSLYHCLWE